MGAFSKIQAYSFALLLSKPFKDWKAFELGLIDEKGNVIQKPKTTEEKNSLDAFETLIRKVKKILIKFIPDSRFLQLLVATYLLKSESNNEVINELNKKLSDKEIGMLYSLFEDNYKLFKNFR